VINKGTTERPETGHSRGEPQKTMPTRTPRRAGWGQTTRRGWSGTAC